MAISELKTKIYFNRGEKDKLYRHLSKNNFNRCGVVIDKNILPFDAFKDMISNLKKNLKYCKILTYDLGKEPTYGYLNTVKDYFKQGEIECLIGIGGGSVIDVAKGLAVLVNNPVNDSVELRGFPEIKSIPIPVVAIPTISGTGTEVTYNAVFSDESEKRKLGINTKYNFPVFSLLDPELVLTAPLKESLSSALDCLVHSLDSFMSKKATATTRHLSIESFYYVFSGIQDLLKDTKDVEAREKLMRASYMAGTALMNSSAGPAGALSYPLGILFGIPHGWGGAFFLQYVLDYNLSKGYTDFYLLYDKVNQEGSISPEEKSRRIVTDIIRLLEKAGVPKKLSEFGVKKEDLYDFSKYAARDLRKAFEMNPVDIPRKELDRILIEIL